MVDDNPSIEPLLEAADEYLQNRNVSRALFCLNQALEWEIADIRLWKGLAACHFILGDFDRALEYWEKAAELDPFDPEAKQQLALIRSPSFQSWLKRMSEAVRTIEIKDYLRARDLFKDLLEEKDGVVSLYQILGLSHMACSDPESARRIWTRGLYFDASNAMLKKYLNSLDEIQKNQEEPGAEEKPSNQGAGRQWSGAGSLVLAGCLSLFLLTWIGFGANAPVDNSTRYQPGQDISDTMKEPIQTVSAMTAPTEVPAPSRGALPDQERMAKPIPIREDANEPGFKQDLTLYREGYNAYLKGDLNTARGLLIQVVNKGSGSYINRESLYYLARVSYLLRQYSEAEKYFQQYLNQFPDTIYHDDSLYYLGCLYHRNGHDAEALQFFDRLALLDPGSGYLSSPECREVMSHK